MGWMEEGRESRPYESLEPREYRWPDVRPFSRKSLGLIKSIQELDYIWYH
jgi:hypothetical protein